MLGFGIVDGSNQGQAKQISENQKKLESADITGLRYPHIHAARSPGWLPFGKPEAGGAKRGGVGMWVTWQLLVAQVPLMSYPDREFIRPNIPYARTL